MAHCDGAASALCCRVVSLPRGAVVARKYRIERLLGSGGMGHVYVATNRVTQGQVALKVMHDDLRAREELIRRFLQEAQVAPRVRHPGVVRVFDAGQDGPLLWIAMELLEGESLGERLKRGSLRADEIERVFAQMLEILEYVHRAEIVHRDLKPPNVFLERTPGGGTQVRLLDFGIAKLSDSRLGSYATQVGTFIGSLGYMSPEQMKQAKDVDARTDVYSVGVMLYECLCGALPYRAETFGDLVAKHHTEAPLPLPHTSDERLQRLGQIAMACLAVDREQRPASVAVLQRALREARGTGASGQPPASATRSSMLPMQPRRPRVAHVLAATSIVALVLGGISLWETRRAPSPLSAASQAGGVRLVSVAERTAQASGAQADAHARPHKAESAPAVEEGRDSGARGREGEDASQALAERTSACQRGELERCLELGEAYETGQGVGHDPARAGQLYARACFGGLTRECGKAFVLNAAACRDGELRSCFYVAQNYWTGLGAASDETLAVASATRACEGGDAEACELAAGYSVKRAPVRAIALFTRACEGGAMKGCNTLGWLHSDGQYGLPKDEARGFALHIRACDGGAGEGCFTVAWKYENGQGGVTKDLGRAATFYQRACELGFEHACEFADRLRRPAL